MSELLQKSPQEILDYENTKSEFSDYTRFEDSAERRQRAREALVNNRQYQPAYDYSALDFLIDTNDSEAGLIASAISARKDNA